MFAGIITSPVKRGSGNRLVELANAAQGLANIPYDDSDNWQSTLFDSSITLVQQRYWNSAESKRVNGIISHSDSQTRIVAWARIDNRIELLNKLPEHLHSLGECDDGLILAAYLHWGEQACQHLVGDFAFAIYNGRDNSWYCGRDHTGVKPYYYYFDGKQFALATSMAVLNQLPGLDLTLSKQWLARYLVSASADWTLTAYQQIKKLPPAHTLTFANNKIALNRYFTFSPEPDLILGNDEEYVEAYREVLHQAVTCRVQSDYPIGSELSGGLDSSTITALAARTMQYPARKLHTFGFDESELTPECIIAISQTNPMAMTHFASKTRGRDPNITNIFLQSHGTPVEHPNATSHHVFYECAQKLGIRTLLSGFGGDEFVTSAAPLALVEFWRDKQFKLFFSRQRGTYLKPLHTARWLYHYYRFGNYSITSRRLQISGQQSWPHQLVKQCIADQYDLETLAAEYLVYDGGRTRQNDFALHNRWAPIMTARYENCTLMAAHYGIDYRWPLMDIRLLKLFLSIPASQKLGPGRIGRYLHRRTMVNVLPDFIVWKDKDMKPFKFWERLKFWFKHTSLANAIKWIIRSLRAFLQQIPRSTTSNNKSANRPTQPIQLHPQITSMIDRDKLKQTLEMLNNPYLSKQQNQMLRRITSQPEKLNYWLNTKTTASNQNKVRSTYVKNESGTER